MLSVASTQPTNIAGQPFLGEGLERLCTVAIDFYICLVLSFYLAPSSANIMFALHYIVTPLREMCRQY